MSMMISFLVVNCIARIVISVAAVETIAVDSRHYFSKKAEVPSVGKYRVQVRAHALYAHVIGAFSFALPGPEDISARGTPT